MSIWLGDRDKDMRRAVTYHLAPRDGTIRTPCCDRLASELPEGDQFASQWHGWSCLGPSPEEIRERVAAMQAAAKSRLLDQLACMSATDDRARAEAKIEPILDADETTQALAYYVLNRAGMNLDKAERLLRAAGWR